MIHLLFVARSWQTDVVSPTLMITQDIALLKQIGSSPLLLEQLFQTALAMTYAMDMYSWIPTSFPHFFFILTCSGDQQEIDATLLQAKQEWELVLGCEKELPNFLATRYPVTTWHVYREIMTVRALRHTSRNIQL